VVAYPFPSFGGHRWKRSEISERILESVYNEDDDVDVDDDDDDDDDVSLSDVPRS